MTPFTADPLYLFEVAEKNHDNFVRLARVSLDIRTGYLRARDEAFQVVHSLVTFPHILVKVLPLHNGSVLKGEMHGLSCSC